MTDVSEAVLDSVEKNERSRLGGWVGVCVAITATLMAICNIKDGNIVQTMDRAQAKAVDAWAYYQSKSTKAHLAEHTIDEVDMHLELDRDLTVAQQNYLHSTKQRYQGQVAKYEAEKESIRKEAEGYAAEYDRLNVHDDQLDMAEALFTVAIALFGITAITDNKRLLAVAGLFSVAGTILGLSSFLGWSVHPEWLATLLG